MPKTTFNRPPATRLGQVFLLLLFVLLACNSNAQKTNCPTSHKQADIWYFGEYAGIDFTGGSAVPLTDQNVMKALKASSIICDSTGKLLFFTNGKQVWDRSFNMMQNATNLFGDPGGTQPCIIVQQPRSQSFYYLFTLDLAIKPNNTGLSYSIIDMSLNGGLGDGTNILNVPLINPVCQKITAVNNYNNSGIWVIVHKWESADFYAYLVDRDGIRPPVISTAGSLHGGGSSMQTNAEGSMKASPDGHRLALAITGDKKVELFDFDNITGKVSNGLSTTFTDDGVHPYGVEFSSDSKKLYASLIQRGGPPPPNFPSLLYQFNLIDGLNNPVLIGSANGVIQGTMQLAPDGRIYISRTISQWSKKDSLDVIYNPTRPGLACNFNQLDNTVDNRFWLAGRNGLYSLPNFNQSYVNIPIFTFDSVCHGDPTKFHITNKANIESVTWDFGDGTFSSDWDPMHVYANSGTYQVQLTEVFNGQSYTDTVTVKIYPLPSISLVDTVLLYAGSSINLHAGKGFTEYLWSTGSRDSVINVASQGTFWAEVKDIHCCFNSDTTYVKVFEYFVPNAFTPNGDGVNDVFRVFALYENVSFKMVVYDRWGQLVFESDNIDDGWDGNFKNQNCPPESYVWIVNIGFLGQDIITQGDIVFKGSVTIVR